MSNVDARELAKFSELAHRWWDPEGEFRPLHEINPLRLAWIESLVPLAGRRVADVGCGGGILAESMARRGADVLGIDLSTKPLKVVSLPGVHEAPGERRRRVLELACRIVQVLALLLAFSVMSWAVILYKWMAFRSADAADRRFMAAYRVRGVSAPRRP